MILEYNRYYPNFTAFRDLQGSNCFLCKEPYINTRQARLPALKCDACDWSLTFDIDANNCIRPYVWTYKSFAFCLYAPPGGFPKLWLGNSTYWIPLRETRIENFSLRACLDTIKSGEANRARFKIRKKNGLPTN